MAQSYQDLLSKVLEIEKDTQVQSVIHIDISSVFSTQTPAVPGYYELLNQIGEDTSISKPIKQSKHNIAYVEPQLVNLSNKDDAGQKETTKGIALKAAPNPLKAQAKEEIDGLALAFKKIGSTRKKETKIKQVKATRDLILPSLSTQDQLAELERIIGALNTNSLDAEQMKIVVSEIKGLAEYLSENPDKSSGPLTILRDQKLAEANSLVDKLMV